jgi:hypothetical protein
LQSGEEASLVVKEAEQNDTKAVQVIRDPPVTTINKSTVYTAYDLIYLWVKHFETPTHSLI